MVNPDKPQVRARDAIKSPRGGGTRRVAADRVFADEGLAGPIRGDEGAVSGEQARFTPARTLGRVSSTIVAARTGLAVALLLTAVAGPADAAPKPKPRAVGGYDLDIVGFNDGEPYQLHGAEAEAVLSDPGAEIYRFTSKNWLEKPQTGHFQKVADAAGRFPQRRFAELVDVFQIDLDSDQTHEFLLVPTRTLIGPKHRYAPTLIRLNPAGVYQVGWAATDLPGEVYKVVDIRDLNADSQPEILLSGAAGQSGFYQFHQVIGQGTQRIVALPVAHTDSLHYVDLNRDKALEIVVRERVGRRGPADQWTYIDRLHRWDGHRFSPADQAFSRYHDQETLPNLIAGLIDNYAAKRPILQEKIAAVKKVRTMLMGWVKAPRQRKKTIRALRALKRRQLPVAKELLTELDAAYAYDTRVLIGLAEVHAANDAWDEVLSTAIRALTVEPEHRAAWWWAGLAFAHLSEKSSAIASFYLVAALSAKREDGLQFLKARRGGAGMDGALQSIIDEALAELAQVQ